MVLIAIGELLKTKREVKTDLGNLILIIGFVIFFLSYPVWASGDKQDKNRINNTKKSKKIHDIGKIEVSAKGNRQGVSLTPSENIIDLNKFEITGTAQNITDIVTKLPVFDFRGKTDLVPDDDTVYMRGFSSKRFSTSIDGMTIRKTGGRKSSHIVDYALLPPWMFESIEVKPGPHFAAYPGKSIGGVLNLISKTPEKYESLKPDINFGVSYGSYNTLNNNMNLSCGAGNFIYDFGYQKYHTDGYLRHTKADIDMFFSRIGYILPSDGYITLSVSYTDADRETTVYNDPDTAYDDGYPVVESTTFYHWQEPTWNKEAVSYRLNFKQPSPVGTWTAQAYYGEENRDYSYLDWVNKKNHSLGVSDASWDTKWHQQGGMLYNEINIADSHIITVGAGIEQCYDGYGRTARWSSPQEDKKRIEIASGYIEDKWTIVQGLNLTAGLRYEDITIQVNNFSSSGIIYITGRDRWIERDWNEFLPKLFLTWELDDLADSLRDTSLSLGASKIWRAPDYHGDYNPQGRPAGAWLDPEYGIGCDFVFSRRLSGDINLKINYAYYEIKDFIAYNRQFAEYTPPNSGAYDFQGLEYKDYRINLKKVIQQTVELQAGGHIFDDLSFYFGYAFLDFDNKGGEPAGEMECDQRAKHRVNTGIEYNLSENTSLFIDHIYQDEQITEKSVGTPQNPELEEVKMDSYNVFNFAVKQTLFDTWGQIKNGNIKLYVNNLFDEEYMNSDGYPATDRTYGAAVNFSF